MYIDYNVVVTHENNIYYVGIPKITDYEDGTYSYYDTYADTLEEALNSARDLLVLNLSDYVDNKKDIPKTPNSVEILKTLKENQFLTKIFLDLEYEVSKVKQTYKKKTLTIPTWLDILAQRKNLNFSQVLQNALKKELNIK